MKNRIAHLLNQIPTTPATSAPVVTEWTYSQSDFTNELIDPLFEKAQENDGVSKHTLEELIKTHGALVLLLGTVAKKIGTDPGALLGILKIKSALRQVQLEETSRSLVRR